MLPFIQLYWGDHAIYRRPRQWVWRCCRMNIVYTIARSILNIAKWFWTAAIIPLILALIAALLPLFAQSKPGDPLYALLAPGPVRTITFLILGIIFGVLLLVPLICWLILLSEGRVVGNRTLRKYLHR